MAIVVSLTPHTITGISCPIRETKPLVSSTPSAFPANKGCVNIESSKKEFWVNTIVSVFPKRSLTFCISVPRTESPTTKLPVITAAVMSEAMATSR